MSLQPGTTLGPYAVTAKIGEGGMGEVYRARDTKLDRDVALKMSLVRTVNRWWLGTVSLFIVATAVWGCTAPDSEPLSGSAPATSAAPHPPLTRLTVDGPVGALLVGPAVSPDGQTIAFRAFRQGQSQIYVHSRSDVEAVPLLAAGEGGHGAGFSPDGHILLVTDRFDPRILRRVPLAGGPVTAIGEGGNLGGSWGPDDTIVLGSDEGLWLKPASGGARTPLTTLSDGEEGHWLPQFLPSGRAVLFFIQTGDRDTGQVAVYDLDTDERRTLLAGTDAGYATSGHLVFWRDGALWAVRFDPDRLEVSGAPVAVLEPLDADPNGDAWYAISREGTLVYIPPDGGVAAQRSLVWVDRRGQEEPLGMPRRTYAMARLSPDGRRIAANTERLGDLFLYDRETQVDEQFTSDPGLDIAPVWTPDGSQIIFASTRHGGVPNLYIKSADGSGVAARLTTTDVPHIATGWADDGETLLVAGGGGMSTLRLGTAAAPEKLLETDHNETPGSISPNGRWLAYVSDASGVRQVYVRPFPDVGSGGELVVSDGPGEDPLWGPDGRELFYQTADAAMVVSFDTGETFQQGPARQLFSMKPYYQGFSANWDMAPDGQRFLMIKRDEDGEIPHVIVVQHWFEELTRLVPTE